MKCTSLENAAFFNQLPLAKQLESLALAGSSSKLSMKLVVNGKLKCSFADNPAFSQAYKSDNSPSRFYDAGLAILIDDSSSSQLYGVLQIQMCEDLEDRWYGNIFMRKISSSSNKWSEMWAVTSLEIIE